MNPSGWHLEESIWGDLHGPLLSPPPPPPPQDLLFPLTASLAAEVWLAAAAAAEPEGAENCRMKPVTRFFMDGISEDDRREQSAVGSPADPPN